MNIKPIKTAEDHQKALVRIDELWDAEPNTEAADELDILVTLVEAYEEAKYKIDAPDPVEAIKFRMDQEGLKDSDLVPFLGQRSRVSEVLNRKRRLTLPMIRRLHSGLYIPLECLVMDYELDRTEA
ncbi:helix-turn-helix domain-containing protein [Idiomarina piscisalsi]|uniref:DNA-binding protein n=1 Tax=Idiomarina piscisalsi TaxID=1096243 RepID=A0A432YIC0_9GAMM|nr:DNA-binding protein [Idiomarina piscisalsi]RUO60711.1 DNA-binding protein [Idiomarina piscisalsi]